MRRVRLFFLAFLAVAPLLTLAAFGMYHLWSTGLGLWVGWPLTGCMILAYLLAWRWLTRQHLLRLDDEVPMHWTERDHEAWALVEARAQTAVGLKTEQLTDFPFFVDTAQAMALELARFYHPTAQDPLSSLTIPEILTVVELAARDLRAMVDQYLPGGHLLTIHDMRRLKQLADWYPTASNITWLLSSVFAPLNTAIRYLAVQAGTSKPWQLLQDNVLVWFFTAYVHRLGGYLIELNSGRLHVGADRYLQLQKANRPPSQSTAHETAATASPAEAAPAVTLVLLGQAKAGKSSLINALLGEQKAIADVVTATSGITRYELRPAEVQSRLSLIDTVGYGQGGPGAPDKRLTQDAARQADLILLVLHARNPARQADVDFLRDLVGYFAAQPELRKPPIAAVLTHIDLLNPSLEWAPPYDWQKPKRAKEVQIDQAVEHVREQLGAYLAGIVPACTASGNVYGVSEWLLPLVIELLDEAHATAFLRCLKAEKDAGKIRKVFAQLLALGKGLGKMLLQSKANTPNQRS